MPYSSSSGEHILKRRGKKATVPLRSEQNSQVIRSPSQNSGKGWGTKEKVTLTAYSAEERFENMERTQ